MMYVQQFLESPVVMRLGWALVHFLWQGAAVALGLWVTLAVMRGSRPQSRYLAAVAALVLLSVFPVVTFGLLARGATVTAVVPVAGVQGSLSRSVDTGVAAIPAAADAPRRDEAGVRPAARPEGGRGERRSHWAPALGDMSQRFMARLQGVAPWLVPVWLLGVAVLALWNLAGYASLRRLKIHTAGPVDAAIERMARRIAEAMGVSASIRVHRSAEVDSPLVIGFLKPVILVPVALLTELPLAQVEALLAHELAHIRRHDPLVNLFQVVVETVLFYHPAVWWISRRVRSERELCCDDMAVARTGDAKTYVRALAAVANVRAPALAAGASGGVLLQRLRRLLGLRCQESGSAARTIAGASVMLLLVFAVVACGLRERGEDTDARTQGSRPIGYVYAADGQAGRGAAGESGISGRVIDADGKPVSGATVSLFSESTWQSHMGEPATETSDAAGRFKFQGITKGRTDVWAEASLGTGWVRGLGSNRDDVTIQLAPKGATLTFGGTLFDTDGKTLLSGARVALVREPGDEIAGETKTDGKGHYQLTVGGRHGFVRTQQLICIAPGRALAWYTVPSCSADNVDFQVKPAATLTGRVLDPGGVPLAGASCHLGCVTDEQYGRLVLDNIRGGLLSPVMTGKDGRFALEGVPRNAYVECGVVHPEYALHQTDPITANKRSQTLGDIRLVEGAVVEGTAYLSSRDHPVAGAKVSLDYPVYPPKSAVTDKDGHYRFAGVVDGTHHGATYSQLNVVAEAGGSPAQWEASIYCEKPVNGGDHVTIDLPLQRSIASLQAEWKQQPGRASDSKYNMVVLEDADADYGKYAAHDDTLTVYGPGHAKLWQKTGINTCQDIGGFHAMAVDRERKTIWVCEEAGERLLKYASDGTLLWEGADVGAAAVAIDPKTGNAWVLTSKGIIYGDRLQVYSPENKKLEDWEIGGSDIAYSPVDDCFWVVGKSYKKIARDGRVMFSAPTEFAWVAPSVSVNAVDGSVWIAESRHPNVMASRGTVLIVNADGNVRKTFSVDVDTRCVAVDAERNAAWIAGMERLTKVDLEGNVLVRVPLNHGFRCVVEPDTGYVWLSTLKGLWELDGMGKPVWSWETGNETWVAPIPR